MQYRRAIRKSKDKDREKVPKHFGDRALADYIIARKGKKPKLSQSKENGRPPKTAPVETHPTIATEAEMPSDTEWDDRRVGLTLYDEATEWTQVTPLDTNNLENSTAALY